MARSATDPVSFDRRCVELVLARIAQPASGDELTPEECAETGSRAGEFAGP